MACPASSCLAYPFSYPSESEDKPKEKQEPESEPESRLETQPKSQAEAMPEEEQESEPQTELTSKEETEQETAPEPLPQLTSEEYNAYCTEFQQRNDDKRHIYHELCKQDNGTVYDGRGTCEIMQRDKRMVHKSRIQAYSNILEIHSRHQRPFKDA